MADKLLKTYSIGSQSFYCENCVSTRFSPTTTIRIFESGIQVEINKCDVCKKEQQTEYFKGPTIRLQNSDEEV